MSTRSAASAHAAKDERARAALQDECPASSCDVAAGDDAVDGGAVVVLGGTDGAASSARHQTSVHTLTPPLRQARCRASLACASLHAEGWRKLARHASQPGCWADIASSVHGST
ncbi:MAG: hypothetical protein J0L92_21865 [Deltaproteobacteria bacterium]|nr:hypothetical protein [Deltaproteobacteria bacterium]